MPMSSIEERAKKARDKKARFGSDVDLEAFDVEARPHSEVGAVEDLPSEVKKAALNVGVSLDQKSGGTYIQMDQTPVMARSETEGIEILDIAAALQKYDGLKDYWWKQVMVDQDKYTADVAAHPPAGYFLRARAGASTVFPLKSCLYLGQTNLNQRVHNIIIAEEGSELHVITGCTTPSHVQKGLHIGVSEFYIKKGAHVSFTMIHSWGKEVEVRPRTSIHMEEGSSLSNNYICLSPAKTLQTNPSAYLNGPGAKASFNSVIYAAEGSLDLGSQVYLRAPGCSADSVARAVSVGGDITARGLMVGEVPDVKAHLECVGLILSEKGRIYSIPELDGRCGGLDMSHEAAVGKISEVELEYLMARGLSLEQATGVIVRGFLDVEIKGLPDSLKEELRKITQLQELHGGA
ncbi:MAG: cysteine desulfurase activator complex subunit SufB [Methanosaeta sp. PtaB.Bin039]|nr:MAG: cysteine desulfurase activator complex subunit SufB [Methanosaeta sp. PtaB.Bin039]HQF16147.1 SufD family Fe-S cluster assembly protein [Methanotrichaceae archaeon]HQI90883.1 SufD family Fe-S cluster assembly protein [Methanotrichaceae archaeon]